MSMALPGVSATSTRIGCRAGHSWADDVCEKMAKKPAKMLA
jgi:hypothetical protein